MDVGDLNHVVQLLDRPAAVCECSRLGKVRQCLAAVAAALAALSVGTLIGWSSPVQPQLQTGNVSLAGNDTRGLVLDEIEMSWVGSLLALGCLAGSIIGGFVIEALGRKLVLVTCSVPLLTGWILTAAAAGPGYLYAGRTISGVGAGICCVAAPAYIGEISIPSIRGILGSLFQVMVNLGIVICGCLGLFLDWRWISGLCTIIPVSLSLSMLFVPETPYYLLKRGKTEEARTYLKWLRGVDIQSELAALKRTVDGEKMKPSNFTDVLRWNNLKPVLVAVGLMFCQQFCGVNAAIFYTADIFRSTNTTMDPLLCNVIIGSVMSVVTLLSLFVVDQAGRRFLLVASQVFCAVGMAGLGAYFYIRDVEPETGVQLGWLPLTSLVVFIAGFGIGLAPMPWLMSAEIVPARVKGPGTSIASFSSWLMAFVVTKTFVDLQQLLTEAGAFWFYSGMCVAGTVFCFLFVPETKGRTPEEIQQFFTKKNSDRVSSARTEPE